MIKNITIATLTVICVIIFFSIYKINTKNNTNDTQENKVLNISNDNVKNKFSNETSNGLFNNINSDSKLYKTRDDIVVGRFITIENKNIKVKYSNEEEGSKNYFITSKKIITIPDDKINHTVFEVCYIEYIGMNLGSCEVMAINSSGKIIEIIPPSSTVFDKGSNPNAAFLDYVHRLVKLDNLNSTNTTSGLYIRPEYNPYIFQKIECGDATLSGGCNLYGVNIDKDNDKIRLSGEGGGISSDPELTGDIYSPISSYSNAERLVNGKNVKLSVYSYQVNSTSTTKKITIDYSIDSEKTSKTLYTIRLPKDVEVSLDYNFENLDSMAEVIIGDRLFKFDFITRNFEEK